MRLVAIVEVVFGQRPRWTGQVESLTVDVEDGASLEEINQAISDAVHVLDPLYLSRLGTDVRPSDLQLNTWTIQAVFGET